MFWVLMLALVLMYARLYLNAHSPLQVVGGFLLGLFCVFLPNLLLIYA
jgi:membrane-associated phospholipid phosphatase